MTEESKLTVNSDWQVEVDRATPAEWAQMLDLFNDANLYQTWAYGRVRWGEESLSHLVLKRNGEVQGIAQLRIVRPTSLKFGMAYLRWGPLCERRGQAIDPEVFVRMAQALEEEYVSKRKLFVRIVPNAFTGSPRAEVIQSAFSTFNLEPLVADNTYRTLVVDLAPSPAELRKNFDPKWRNKLSGAEKNNLKIVAGDGNEEFSAFCQIYKNMRNRKSFETTVDVEEFGRIQADLEQRHRMRVLVCEDQGVPVAGVVATAMGDSAIYLLGATSDQGLHSKGAYLLQWTMLQWLKQNGIRWYDLGGIDPEGNPGVYTFKKGMSGSDTYQLNPLVASKSTVSSAIAKAGMAVQRAFRSSSGGSNLTHALKQPATKN
ncbi:MAG: peptidoglycan bridge formation glycyltransferase FemA/FemB family protein [Candidatus Acidiferrum sp.]